MRLAFLVLPIVLAQTATTCTPACADTEKCVACGDKTVCVPQGTVFTCGSNNVTCSSDCNGATPPILTELCWDGSRLRPVCDMGVCRWVSSTCPRNPCDPSPCKTTEKCCVPSPNAPCPSAFPLAAGAQSVCYPAAGCQCNASATLGITSSIVCFDGSIGGSFCAQETGGTCSWKTRDCPTDPCKPDPCPVGQTCLATAATLGAAATTITANFTCASSDRCTNLVVCAGLGKCFNGECVCDASVATRPVTQCPDGQITPIFNNDPAVCQYVDKPCQDPKVPPVCTGTDVVINLATDPACVPPTNPCVTPIPVICDRGLKCVPDRVTPTKPTCVCTGCPDNGIRPTICYNGELSQYCDLRTCQFVPNPDCNIPDPCSTIKCQDGFRCVNMGSGIVAGPMCVPRDPCNPNPCSDTKTVCKAAIDVSTNTVGVSSLGGARAFMCVPVPIPDPTTCDPNPCANGGVCFKSVAGPVCRCQKGWTGRFCLNLDCEDCSLTTTKQCRTPNAVLSSDGATYREFCVCNEIRIKGDACNTVESGTDGRVSPDVIVPIRDGTDSKAAVTGTSRTSFQIKGGRLEQASEARFKGDPIVVELDRLDADGKSNPGPMAKGDFARIKICSQTFLSTKEPDLFLVESTGLRDSKKVCVEINAEATIPGKTFIEPNCWVFPVCHASTYAAGTPVDPTANHAAIAGLSVVAGGLGLLAL